MHTHLDGYVIYFYIHINIINIYVLQGKVADCKALLSPSDADLGGFFRFIVRLMMKKYTDKTSIIAALCTFEYYGNMSESNKALLGGKVLSSTKFMNI